MLCMSDEFIGPFHGPLSGDLASALRIGGVFDVDSVRGWSGWCIELIHLMPQGHEVIHEDRTSKPQAMLQAFAQLLLRIGGHQPFSSDTSYLCVILYMP